MLYLKRRGNCHEKDRSDGRKIHRGPDGWPLRGGRSTVAAAIVFALKQADTVSLLHLLVGQLAFFYLTTHGPFKA
ncbi:hypothetical protein [Siphonobacter curvatus]|uniref:hypothetical protein n=1 Tax=Siphonobacter curvatus TaxID=2094562 RepID=UPI0013FDDDB6